MRGVRRPAGIVQPALLTIPAVLCTALGRVLRAPPPCCNGDRAAEHGATDIRGGGQVSISSRGFPGRVGSLPVPPHALVGRAAELDLLNRLLTSGDKRLVTITGPPGVGKTRLATAAAIGLGDRFGDGVIFADLTAVRNAELVPVEIAGALGAGVASTALPTAEDLTAAVADRELLLVVDNFEHVLPGAACLAVALARCPGLRVLVTSRERLHLRAEREVPLSPLALPGPADAEDVCRLASTPSVEMLIQRVRDFDPAFAVTPANRAALAEICIRLDGLPLALELAAARLRLFSPGELTFRLRHRVALLTSDTVDVPDRHRTLRAALTWSHELLTSPERTLFRRLSVFVGGWTLDAAAEVCAVADVVATSTSLVDKSLILRRYGDRDVAHLDMLESLREFATELLEQAGETEATRARHAEHFARLGMRIEARIGTAEEGAAVEEVGVDVGNLREALGYSLSADRTELALPLAAALGWYCYTRGQLGSGLATLEAALVAAGGTEPPDDALAGALLMAGVVAFARGELDRAEEHLARSLGASEQTGSLRRLAIAHAFLGHVARARGHLDDAVVHHQCAGRLHGQLDNAPGVAWSRYDLGLLARRRGDRDGAAELLRESLCSFRDLTYPWAIGHSAWALASVELGRGRSDDAAPLLAEALASFEAMDDGRGLAQCLEAVAALARARSRYRDAARLLGAAAALRDRLAAPLPAEEERAHLSLTQSLRQELGSGPADAFRRAGRELRSADVLALARKVLAGPAEAAAAPREPTGPLTRREYQVAMLVRRGCTNRQIGRQLGISEKTIEVHVHHSLHKLGASSRAEIAAWVAAQERDTVP